MEIIKLENSYAVDMVIALPKGLHARPAAKIAQAARKYKAELLMRGETGEVDAKSMLDILSLAPANNSVVRLIATGEDAQDALIDIYNLIVSMRKEHGKNGN